MVAEVDEYSSIVGYSVYDGDSMYPWRAVMSEQGDKGEVGGCVHE